MTTEPEVQDLPICQHDLVRSSPSAVGKSLLTALLALKRVSVCNNTSASKGQTHLPLFPIKSMAAAADWVSKLSVPIILPCLTHSFAVVVCFVFSYAQYKLLTRPDCIWQ